jgi:hypothetical protein
VSTKHAAIEPSSDVNEVRDDDTEDRSRESVGRGERPDGSAEVPDRQLRYRNV